MRDFLFQVYVPTNVLQNYLAGTYFEYEQLFDIPYTEDQLHVSTWLGKDHYNNTQAFVEIFIKKKDGWNRYNTFYDWPIDPQKCYICDEYTTSIQFILKETEGERL